MLKEIKEGFFFTLVTMVLFGVLYPVLVWGMGRIVSPRNAEGSFIRKADGTILGSELLGQAFTRGEYFHGRPSAVDYDAASTGGSNYAASNPDHLKAVRDRAEAIAQEDDVRFDRIPSDLVTTSGGGLDPHISPEAALIQVERVARERGVAPERVRQLVEAHVEGPTFGLLGKSRVNVLELNLALDSEIPHSRRSGGSAPAPSAEAEAKP
jgi:potassium-transporting ATPase KdpC subunit